MLDALTEDLLTQMADLLSTDAFYNSLKLHRRGVTRNFD